MSSKKEGGKIGRKKERDDFRAIPKRVLGYHRELCVKAFAWMSELQACLGLKRSEDSVQGCLIDICAHFNEE